MKKLILGFALFVLVWTGCFVPEQEAQTTTQGLTLMTWNVHNLFDGKDDGFEYAEFRQDSGWSQEKYLDRINSISAAISGLHKKPDIILLQEIESLTVLEDLAASLSAGYSWSHFAGNYGAAVGLGLISRLPLGESMAHSITIGSETSPRPVLEVRIDNDVESFVIFICHWKSKLGGDDATEPLRRASARVILRRMRELWEHEPELGMIIAGDLNLNHNDFYRRGSNIITALLPDDPYCAEIAGVQTDFFILSRNKPPQPVYFADEYIVLFSPWMEDLENGTYYYAYNWETIDHFLLSNHFFNDFGWEYESASIINYHPFVNANGIPAGYNQRTGNGLSDHLPLMVSFKKAAKALE
ncbi:MAG: endonuclease/exonuclease/phosphatase family protein [Treponema sp.]|jgi:endonuclease/exonuclease/phosphatase family metal-dependent hydrolase|nr:endonuclease/exonuclease/phosphatase family protein [Treponema sp.]